MCTIVPSPSVDSIPTLPPWLRTIPDAMTSPRPVPGVRLVRLVEGRGAEEAAEQVFLYPHGASSFRPPTRPDAAGRTREPHPLPIV
jgi:hypothetical protein